MSNSNQQWPAWPHYDERQIQGVIAALQAGAVNYWNGQQGRQFEQDFARWVGTQHGIALSNGSVSLDLILEVLGIGEGDEVVVTPRSFVASASCIARCGAVPVFADIDRDSQNITPESVAAVITPRTKAIMAVHLAGWPCDMPGMMELADRHGLHVIEDCAQAHGASIGGQNVGTFGVASSFSFCTDKIMTTGGEGGIVVTNDTELYELMWRRKDHGKNRHKTTEPGEPGMFKWLVDDFGTNYRMSELPASIARAQLEVVDEWVAKRRANAAVLSEGLAEVPGLRLTPPPSDVVHAYYKFYAFVEPERLRDGWTRERILAEVIDKGIPVGSGSCSEIYQEHAFQQAGFVPPEPLPIAAELGATSLMFQVHPTLEQSHMQSTVQAVSDVMHEACN